MTLTVREAMQALLDGKTIRIRNTWGTPYLKKLDGEGNLIQFCENGPWEDWFNADDFYQAEIFEEVEEVEKYPLTFEQALRAMLDGEVVECGDPDRSRYRFNRESSCIEWLNERFGTGMWTLGRFDNSEQRGKWKVVE